MKKFFLPLVIGIMQFFFFSGPSIGMQGQYSVIRVKNPPIFQLRDLIQAPKSELRIDNIDGRDLGFFQSHEELKISPGRHRIIIHCSIKMRVFGTAILNLNTKAGQFYEISYPDYIYNGVDLDYSACNKLIIHTRGAMPI